MESVHSLSFGAAVLKVLKDAKIEDDSQGGGENDETRFCKTVFSASGASCPNNGTAGRYTLSRDRRESEILRTIGQEEPNRQENNPIRIQGGEQCIGIGVMEDNFDFGHILHFRQYKKIQVI